MLIDSISENIKEQLKHCVRPLCALGSTNDHLKWYALLRKCAYMETKKCQTSRLQLSTCLYANLHMRNTNDSFAGVAVDLIVLVIMCVCLLVTLSTE